MIKPKKIILTESELRVDGHLCSSVTVYKRADGKYDIVMFDNEKFVKTKTKLDRWKRPITYKTGTRITMIFTDITFIGFQPSLMPGREVGYYHVKNGKKNYINYYAEPKSVTK